MPVWYTLSCSRASQLNAMQLANVYYESGQFELAEPDLMVENVLQCATDPLWENQWNLLNTGQKGGTPGLDIKPCDAWTITKGDNIKVSVIDQGIDLGHEDLVSNISSLSYDMQTGTSPSVVRGSHGTACAGIVGANDNNLGITGVAPNCKLMSVSYAIGALNTALVVALADGINWSWLNGADVISNSWQTGTITSSLMDNALNNALSSGCGGKGCVVVFSAGNYNGGIGTTIPYPINSNPALLVVGAMSHCGERKSFSSCDLIPWGSDYGPALDVMAPGLDIATTDLTGTDGYGIGNYILDFNGTSSACPQVAGIAALILSVNPSLTALQVRDVIEKNCEKVGLYSYVTTTGRPNGTWNQEMGYGLVNARKAVLWATAIDPPTTDIEARFYVNVMNGYKYIGMRGKYRKFEWPSLYPEFNSGASFSFIKIHSDPPSSLLDDRFPKFPFLPMSYGWADPVILGTAYLNETSTNKWYIGEFKYYNANPTANLAEPLKLDLTELTTITSSQYNFQNVTSPPATGNVYYYDSDSPFGYDPYPLVHLISVPTLISGNSVQLSDIAPDANLYNKTVYLIKLPNLTGH